jgi:hypothetical protein
MDGNADGNLLAFSRMAVPYRMPAQPFDGGVGRRPEQSSVAVAAGWLIDVGHVGNGALIFATRSMGESSFVCAGQRFGSAVPKSIESQRTATAFGCVLVADLHLARWKGALNCENSGARYWD